MKLRLCRVEINRCWEVTTNSSMLSMGEDYTYKEYYSYNRRFFRLIGLWQSHTSFKKMIYISFINFMLTVESFLQVYYLFTSERNLISITKLLETTLPTLCFGFCYCNLLYNNEIMRKIRYRIKCDWGILENKPELELLKKYADVSRRCTVIIAVSFYLNIAFKIFPSLFCIFQYIFGSTSFTGLILPLHIEYSMGNQIKYYFTLFNQYVIMIIVATVGIANYSMFIAVIQHACALFHIVEWRVIEKFKKDPHNIYYARTSSDLAEENKWIIDIIQFYNNAIEFVHLLKSFYETFHLLEEILAFILILVDYFYLFQVLSFTFSATEAIVRILYITGTLFVIYIYSYLAQKLIDHNVNVFLRFCQIPFYLLSLRSQKLLLCLLMSSMRVCSISLKGAIVVSHDLFATFMRKAFSFAMVLYSLQ